MIAAAEGRAPNGHREPESATHAEAIASAEGRIRDGLPGLIDNLLDLARGEVAGKADDGSPIYSRPPDRRACIYLIDRVMGKPAGRQEMSGPGVCPVDSEAFRRALAMSYGRPEDDVREMTDRELHAIVAGSCRIPEKVRGAPGIASGTG